MNVTYVEDGDLALFDGHKFRRDKKTGYYLCSTLHVRLHRYVWEYFNGTIPKGYHVHHIDGNKANNDISNLAMMDGKDHQRLHGETLTAQERQRRADNLTEKARSKASEWHGSAAGREWHRIHGREVAQNVQFHDLTCEVCGNPFKSKMKWARFCSNACKSKGRRESGADNIVKTCPICGEKFTASKYSKAIFCSIKCSAAMKKRTYGKPVIGTDKNGREIHFHSVNAAADFAGVNATSITAACGGRNKTCKGYTWRYAD